MNEDNNIMDFDDRETEDDLLLYTKNMTQEEIDDEFNKIFGTDE